MTDETDLMDKLADELSSLRRGLAARRGRGAAAPRGWPDPPPAPQQAARAFERQVTRLLREQAHAGHLLAVMVVDLAGEDDFEGPDDAGNRLALQAWQRIGALRLCHALRSDDPVRAEGPHDLACVIAQLRSEAVAHAVCLRVAQHVGGACGNGSAAVAVRPQIGVALFPYDGATLDELLRAARTAQWRARRGPFGIAFAAGRPPVAGLADGRRRQDLPPSAALRSAR